MSVGNRVFDFLLEMFFAFYQVGTQIYDFISTEYTLGNNTFTLFEILFGPALIILLGFLIVKGIIF